MIFLDLEKAYDRIPRDLIWWAMRKRSIPEGYVKVIGTCTEQIRL